MIITATGWTFDTVDRLTLWEVRVLTTHWKKHAPAHIVMWRLHRLVGQWLGAKEAPEKVQGVKPDLAQLEGLAEAFKQR